MIRIRIVAFVAVVLALAPPAPAQQLPGSRTTQVQLRFDTTEAAVALSLIEWKKGGNAIEADDWRPLFNSDGYQRLKKREADLQRAFTDTSFKDFILSDTLGKRAVALRTALDKWERADVSGAAARAVAYLPPEARIAATVYIVIKPKTNTFVYDLDRDPSIFVYLDPEQTAAQLENVVAHELHHIGFSTLGAKSDSMIIPLPASVRTAAEYTRAFGEGFAMLAAAGGPDIHPHAKSPPADRARWNSDMAHFNRDLKVVEKFFMDIIDNRFATPDAIDNAAGEFFGVQGPWYTVGWKMAATIEKRFGHAEVIQCMMDPHRLLDRYNAAATDFNRKNPAARLALWSPALVNALKRPG